MTERRTHLTLDGWVAECFPYPLFEIKPAPSNVIVRLTSTGNDEIRNHIKLILYAKGYCNPHVIVEGVLKISHPHNVVGELIIW